MSNLLAATKPANQYSRGQFPALERAVNAPPTGYFRINYKLLPRAAQIVNDHPEILLHYRLHGLKSDKPYCLMSGENRIYFYRETESTEKSAPVHNVYVCCSDEVSVAEIGTGTTENISGNYPAPLMPFDLDRLRSALQAEQLARATGGSGAATLSRSPLILDFPSDPFKTYEMMHSLASSLGQTLDISGLRSVLEIGSGLGTISFILSQFLAGAQITGVEIDSSLVIAATKMAQALSRQFGHDVSNVRFRRCDVFSEEMRASLPGYDAIIGWFPLSEAISDGNLIDLFRGLRRGAYVFQLETCPLPHQVEQVPAGFRYLDDLRVEPYHIFQRI